MGPDRMGADALGERLRTAIRARGPITFAEFMEAALYDPAAGFYSGLPVGQDGAFVTSPHISPVFGRLLANQVDECWRLLGRPTPYDLIEVGGGDGTLAEHLLSGLSEDARASIRYTGVEVSAAGRRAILARGLDAVASLSDAPRPASGCVLANELFDNVPFHRLMGTADGPVELLVGLEGERFALVPGPPAPVGLAALAPGLPPGMETTVSPASLRLLDEMTAAVSPGYAWILDYGFADGGEPRSVHGYRDHRLLSDVLSAPGTLDITSGVDFGALADRARSREALVWGPVLQRDALLALGFRAWDERAQARQIEALNARRGIDAMRIYSDRTRANLLLAREGLGAFHVLCLGIGVDREPAATRRA